MKKIKTPTIKYIRNNESLKKAKLKKHWNKYVNIFIGKKMSERDKEIFFNSSIHENRDCFFLHYKNDPFWSEIMRDLGIASSISNAKGAGWHRKVEPGFQDIYLDGLKVWKGNGFGTNPHRITILKPYEKAKTYTA